MNNTKQPGGPINKKVRNTILNQIVVQVENPIWQQLDDQLKWSVVRELKECVRIKVGDPVLKRIVETINEKT